MANRGNSHPDRDIYNLFVALNQEQHNLDLTSIYEQRWRAMDQSFEVSARSFAVCYDLILHEDFKNKEMCMNFKNAHNIMMTTLRLQWNFMDLP